MVVEAFGQALLNFLDPGLLIYLIAGVVTGLVFGLVPGIGGLLAMALFLPFVFAMPPKYAFIFLVAVSAVCYTGGAITAILLNIPGQEPSVATLLDGFPMTQKGEGGRALGAALMSSGLGGIATVFIALVMVPVIVPMVMAFRSAEMVFIILMGLAFMGFLTKESMIKGLISGGLGLLISLIGMQAKTGETRFTFGSVHLFDGIALIPLMLGLFALPSAIELISKGGTISETGVSIKGIHDVWEGAKDVFRHWTLWLRSVIIGYIIGIVPGIGATAATFIAYGQAKHTSKRPEIFGTGCVEGVIAPESANNAKEAGSLLTTLALGIPGSAGMALLLGAFLMLGLQPGPEMMTKNLPLSFTLLLSLIVANVLATGICFMFAPFMAKVAIIPSRFLAPFIIVIAIVGVYVYRESSADVVVALISTILGVGMNIFGMNRAALVLGFVLGRLFEYYLFIAIGADGPLFFLRPICLILIFIIITLFAFGPIKNLLQRKKGVKQA
jgi:TctA family transporter